MLVVGRFLQELRRRNVFKVGIAYAISAWLLLQITDILVPVLLLPDWVPRFIFLLLVIGLPPALIFAWAYELTPDGLKREKDVEPNESVAGQTGRQLNFFITGVLAVAVGVLLADKYMFDDAPPSSDGNVLAPTIAVLPFDAMSSNPDDENFADGLTEELLNSLAKIGELGVVGRTSSFYYKDRPQDLREIGAALEVAHVLEGSVRRDGDRLRITAQLIQTDSGFHVWSETYDRTMNDIFAIQEEISGHVADALHVAILGSESLALKQHGTTDPDAHARYLIASSYVRRGQAFGLDGSQEMDNLATARRLLEEATALDPAFAEAWAQLAIVYHQLTGWGLPDGSGSMLGPEEAALLADAASAKAIELAPNQPLSLSARATHLSRMMAYNRTESPQALIQEADQLFQRALSAGPEHGVTLELYADFMLTRAEYAQAAELYGRAIALDPLSFTRLRRADALYQSGDAREAWNEFLALGQLYPDAPFHRGIARIEFDRGHFHHGITLLSGERGAVQPLYAWRSLGDLDRAIDEIDYFVSLGGEFELMAPLVGNLLRRDYAQIVSVGPDLRSFSLPGTWVAGIYLRQWQELVRKLDDLPDQVQHVRNYFESFINIDADLGRWIESPTTIASAMTYYAHVLEMTGEPESAARFRDRALEIAEIIPDTTPRGIQERHHVRLLVYASRGEVDRALDAFDAMVDAGWRWMMSAGAFDWKVYAADYGWFEDSPLLDSVRDHPRFTETLEKVRQDNERMRQVLADGISVEDVLQEGVD